MSEVRLHFIQREFEPLRRFEGRSSLRTYLIVISASTGRVSAAGSWAVTVT
jgi:hypothetical protein